MVCVLHVIGQLAVDQRKDLLLLELVIQLLLGRSHVYIVRNVYPCWHLQPINSLHAQAELTEQRIDALLGSGLQLPLVYDVALMSSGVEVFIPIGCQSFSEMRTAVQQVHLREQVHVALWRRCPGQTPYNVA